MIRKHFENIHYAFSHQQQRAIVYKSERFPFESIQSSLQKQQFILFFVISKSVSQVDFPRWHKLYQKSLRRTIEFAVLNYITSLT